MESKSPTLQSVNFSGLINWSVSHLLDTAFSYKKDHQLASVGDFLTRNINTVNVRDDVKYKRVTVKLYNNGVILRDTEIGKNIGTKKQYVVESGYFILSKIDARNGAFGIIPNELNGAIVTNDFPTFIVDETKINPQFLVLITTTNQFIKFAQSCSSGTTNRQRIDIDLFKDVKIPLPSLEDQNRIVKNYNSKILQAQNQELKAKQLEKEIENYLFNELKIKYFEVQTNSKGIELISYSNLETWGVEKLLRGGIKQVLESEKYPNKKLNSLVSINPKTDLTDLEQDAEMSFIPMECISDKYGEVITTKEGFKNKSKGYTKFQDGDLLWARITPCMQNGKSAIVSNLKNSMGYGSTEYHVLRRKDEGFSLEFLYHLLRTTTVRKDAVNHFTGSAGQQRVPKSYLENLSVPNPPLEVQSKISKHITSLKEQIKDLEIEAKRNRELAIKEFELEIFK